MTFLANLPADASMEVEYEMGDLLGGVSGAYLR